MDKWIRKIHIYAGLLVFAHLAIYGIAGLVATFQRSLERPKTPNSVRFVPFSPPPSATDKQVAALVFETLKLPLTRPMPDWFLRRTPENHLLLDFYNINGIYRVVVLEDEGKLRVEDIRNSTWLFLEDVHAATLADRESPPLVRAWAYWNEAGIWCLILFCLSGLYLWLSSRPKLRWAWVSLVCGLFSFAALWVAFRV